MGSAARRTMVRARSGSAWSSAFMLCRFSFQAFGDELAHVFHLERPLGLLHLTAEVHHGEAERTAGADHVHLRLEDLLHADQVDPLQDRKSTRLNSSHITISYAVFCLK